jgi:6-phosphogluconolactonase
LIHRFAEPGAAIAALAEQLLAALGAGLTERGMASLALPGGRTPLPLFKQLRDAPLDWSRVSITLTDERWVPESDAHSNAALLRGALQGSAAAGSHFFPLYDATPGASGAASTAWQSLASVPRPFDGVVLGMGEDGHFASLFPGNTGLSEALDTAAAPAAVMMQAPDHPQARISLNLPALLQTRRLFLLVTGQSKRDLLEAASRARETRWPVSALLAQRQRAVEIYWAP